MTEASETPTPRKSIFAKYGAVSTGGYQTLKEFVEANRSWKITRYLAGHLSVAGLKQDITPEDAIEFSDAILNCISVENKHIENRVGWNLALQGFLFASYAIALSSDKLDLDSKKEFIQTIAILGSWACIFTLIGLYAAFRGINKYKKLWLSNYTAFVGKAVPPFSAPFASMLGRLPSTMVALGMLVAWGYLVVIALGIERATPSPDVRIFLEEGLKPAGQTRMSHAPQPENSAETARPD